MNKNKFAQIRDYHLTGIESKLALEKGLAEASWYTSPVPREKMRELLVRKNGPAIKDTLLWFGLILGFAYLTILLWGTWWFILPYLAYTVLYASTSDSRWHESSHGTAFKSDWMNILLYEISSFMVLRLSTTWRWSHTRHHSDTLIRGRDPEIAVPRPPKIINILLNLFALKSAPAEFKKMFIHASGNIEEEVATYLPKSEYKHVIFKSRIYLLIFFSVIISSIYFSTPFPIMFIGLPTLLGSWLMPLYGLTQHTGLEENVLDHRVNCRTVYMNRVHRFLYWNMNYHIEHHMFPLVPYHALPKLHALIKDDCPPAYHGIIKTFKEIIPAVIKQVKDPSYFVKREVPTNSQKIEIPQNKHVASRTYANEDGTIKVCDLNELPIHDVIRFDCDDDTFAIYRTSKDNFHATEGMCTHGNQHLSDGLIIGDQIECPKHNGRFNIEDGSPKRLPACLGLKTYKVIIKDDVVFLDLNSASGSGAEEKPIKFKVVSNNNVATYIKELVLEPLDDVKFDFTPGDYIHLEIPSHQTNFHSLKINEPFASTWKKEKVFDHHAFNHIKTRRNYSLANNPSVGNQLKFNIRIALPPIDVNCHAGIGSSFVFNLKPGDIVSATGPFGDFHIKDSNKEMIYIGGGAGMAPLRSHILYLLNELKTKRKVSYWYGARSKSELFYLNDFGELADQNENFSFNVALSEALESDNWDSHTGYIHEVVDHEYLKSATDIKEKEFYLCGPPAMIKAVTNTLKKYGVDDKQISFDEF